ncbi:MAG: hypothetical protein Q8P49_01410 [Candidatus Liptonbacteria bacterium]|nr:hypothetical protein [Candidatus Liptonbacteria bacterium]
MEAKKDNNEEEVLICHLSVCGRLYREHESDARDPKTYCSWGCECEQEAYGN